MLDTIILMAGNQATQCTAQFTEKDSTNLTQRFGRQSSSLLRLDYALVPVVVIRSKSLAYVIWLIMNKNSVELVGSCLQPSECGHCPCLTGMLYVRTHLSALEVEPLPSMKPGELMRPANEPLQWKKTQRR